MKKTSSSKVTIAVIIIVIIVVIAYFYYKGNSAPANSSGLVANTPDQTVGSTELALLNEIHSLTLNTSIFQDPAYQTLQDYTVQIPSQAVGRPDPFAPFPGEILDTTPQGGVH